MVSGKRAKAADLIKLKYFKIQTQSKQNTKSRKRKQKEKCCDFENYPNFLFCDGMKFLFSFSLLWEEKRRRKGVVRIRWIRIRLPVKTRSILMKDVHPECVAMYILSFWKFSSFLRAWCNLSTIYLYTIFFFFFPSLICIHIYIYVDVFSLECIFIDPSHVRAWKISHARGNG